MINDSLILNANNKNVKTLIHAVQGENGSRIFKFTVIGTDGEILSLSDCEANFYVSKNDGTVSMLPTVISENSAQVTLTQQACAISGDNDCWLQIVKSSEKSELRVDNLVLRVQKCSFDGAVESSNEFVALTQKIAEANETIKNANQAADSVRQDGAQAIQEMNQNFNTAMTGFTQEIDAAAKKAEDAAGTSEAIAQQTAADTINAQKNKVNGIAGLDSSGKLQQMPTVEDIGTSAIFLASHPVGYIYMTTDPTNPGMRFGGTWVAWGAGRVPVGVNAADTDFSTVEKTGGEKAHILTEVEVAPHRHRQVNYWSGGAGSSTVVTQGLETSDPRVYGGYDVFTESAGGGQAHNNLQPYITCYMWKRVA